MLSSWSHAVRGKSKGAADLGAPARCQRHVLYRLALPRGISMVVRQVRIVVVVDRLRHVDAHGLPVAAALDAHFGV